MQLVIQVLKESSLCYQLSTGTNVFCKCSVARCFVLCLLELRICDWCEIFFKLSWSHWGTVAHSCCKSLVHRLKQSAKNISILSIRTIKYHNGQAE